MHFDIHAKGKSFNEKNLIKNYYNKRTLLASGVQEVICLSENRIELCNRLRSIIQEKQAGNDNTRFGNEMDAVVDKLLEYKYIISTQHKKKLLKHLLFYNIT